MVFFSRVREGSRYRHPSHVADDPICQVCKDRKYVLVATRKLNQSSTVYERQACQACADEESIPVDEKNSNAPQDGKKIPSGTGYLRNKKRRRKEFS